MAKIEISSWDIATKLGLSFLGVEETKDRWGDEVWHRVYEFYGRKIKVLENSYIHKGDDSYNEHAAEIMLSNIGKYLASSLNDWVFEK